MNLWLLERHDRIGYDEAYGFVIAAPDEAAARRLAAEHCGDEGPVIWAAPTTECALLVTTSEVGVVLESLNAE